MGELDEKVCSWQDDEERSFILLLRSSQVMLDLRTAVFWGINCSGYGDLYEGVINSSVDIQGSNIITTLSSGLNTLENSMAFTQPCSCLPFQKVCFCAAI